MLGIRSSLHPICSIAAGVIERHRLYVEVQSVAKADQPVVVVVAQRNLSGLFSRLNGASGCVSVAKQVLYCGKLEVLVIRMSTRTHGIFNFKKGIEQQAQG